MKLAILYTRLSGYFAACLREFCKQTDAELLIFARPAQENAPFSGDVFSGLGEVFDRSAFDQGGIEAHLHIFKPDAVLVSGWIDPAYNRICRKLKAAGVPVIAGCDTQWTGSLRQRLAGVLAPWHLRKFIDVLWVTGNRQKRLAEALGFRGDRCWDGYYACDWGAFARSAEDGGQRTEDRGQKSEIRDQKSDLRPPTSNRPSFLFVGRYVADKGVDVLVKAYARYRTLCEAASRERGAGRAEVGEASSVVRHPSSVPWPLVCAGKGELEALLKTAGVEDCGFVPPEHLPQLMHEASCFVLPSRFEPWGVVVQEAAAAGLPLIVSKACGAGDHLVREGQNGFVTDTGDVEQLAAAMLTMHGLAEDEIQKFARASIELSAQYTPGRWTKTLTEGLIHLRQAKSTCRN